MPNRRTSKNISHRQKMRNRRSLIESTVDGWTLSPRDLLLKQLRDPKKLEILAQQIKKLGGSLKGIMDILIEAPAPVENTLDLVVKAHVDLSELQITYLPVNKR